MNNFNLMKTFLTCLVAMVATQALFLETTLAGQSTESTITSEIQASDIQVSDPVAVSMLEQNLSPITVLQADFVQQQLAEDGYLIRETTGDFIAQKPGKIHWHSDAPFEQLVVSDNESLWVYDPDLEQVTIRAVNNDLSNSPAMLFTGDYSQLVDTYMISFGDSHNVFILQPTTSHSAYQQVKLSFSNQQPTVIEVLDALGENTLISLHNVLINPQTDQTRFTFEPPKDVDIILNN